MRKLHDIIRRCKDEYNFYLFWVEHNIFLAMPLEIKYNGFKRNDAMIRKKRMFTTVEEWSSAYDSYYGVIRQINQKLHEISLTKGKAFETWLQDYKKYSKQKIMFLLIILYSLSVQLICPNQAHCITGVSVCICS